MTTTAALTSQLTDWVAQQGVYAVFGLMALDALLPVGGELIMLYAGALAAGAVSGQQVAVLGVTLTPGLESYVVLALAGSLGYLAGALAGWGIGARGGRALVERHGRWLHISPELLHRAEAWFARHGARAVFLSRITPVVRSFISIPAGILGSRLAPYTVLTLLGSLLWCFGFAAAGWALGGRWETFHRDFRYADYVAVAAVLAVVAAALVHRRRRIASQKV
ncbi:MAG TPA: DedA family protein [Solirubrobacteraceae bacterium]|jgi:membrane protein DedA with SNARE-associated domain|nr:DedA family protein [Solirubrobacteraceae bacterium]